jgi:hypothetical protein
VIRRGFWLLLGAVTGIMGYRRVAAVGQQVSAKLSGTRLAGTSLAGTKPREGRAPAALTARRAARGMLTGAKEAFRFTRDVREGMDLYMDRHEGHPGSTLSNDDLNHDNARDGR